MLHQLSILSLAWHRHIEPIIGTVYSRVCCRPITLDIALEAQLTLEQMVDGVITFTSIDTVDLVVGAHDGRHVCFHRPSKRPQVDFVHCSFVDMNRMLSEIKRQYTAHGHITSILPAAGLSLARFRSSALLLPSTQRVSDPRLWFRYEHLTTP